MLGSELALAGVDAVVIERLPEPSGYSRALTLQSRSQEVFEQRGMNRFGDYQPVPSYNFGLVEMQDSLENSAQLPLFVPQKVVEDLLEERCAKLGADIRRGQDVVGFTQDDDGVTVTVRRADGSEYDIRAAYLVGCDGGRSTVRKLAGVGFPGTDSTANGLTADVYTSPDEKVFVHPTLRQEGFFAAIPVSPGQYRVTVFEFGVPKTSDSIAPTGEEFHSAFKRVSGIDLDILRTGELKWLSRVGNAARLADDYRIGRVFLAGDACHIHLPVSGQGLNTGLQDAFNLGWKLAGEIKGWAPEGLLDTYHAERWPVGKMVCWNTKAQDALLYPLDIVQPLREIMAELVRIPAVNGYLMDMLTGIGIRYPMGGHVPASPVEPVETGTVHPLLGRRVPNAPLDTPDGATTVSATMHDGRAVLIRFGREDGTFGDLGADGGEALLAGRGDRLRLISSAPAPGIDAASVFVRPDGHVAHVGSWDTPDPQDRELRAALATWLGEGAA
jgi:2-polyprenyl-6-methoxyphenol hydroxylase-like FAD-dependent oxidoreductase